MDTKTEDVVENRVIDQALPVQAGLAAMIQCPDESRKDGKASRTLLAWEALERALRAVLAANPRHAEARHKLAILLRQQGQTRWETPRQEESLAELYRAVCSTPSDINEHCPTLYLLARQCRHVTEMGTRAGVSTVALLYAQPDKLVCYDRLKLPSISRLQALAGRTHFVFHQADVRTVEIEETDLLLIDTWHVHEQLKDELRLHAGKVRKYIVLHDTTTFGEWGETAGHRGLWPAVEEFLAQGTFRVKKRYHNNNGLTILQAVQG
jgi:hypothetical protein